MAVILAIAVGLVSGYLSGQFGIGGGLVTTPGIRLVLGRGPLIALGTPLPVMIPAALTGAAAYYRRSLVDTKLALDLAASGVVGVVAGTLVTPLVSAHLLMLLTAVVILVQGMNLLRSPHARSAAISPSGADSAADTGQRPGHNRVAALLVGFGCGFFSGFLGLGGGILLIPAMISLFGKPIKEAFGTSLTVVVAYTVPGTIGHYLLGHIDPLLAGFLIVGVIPGAYVGSRVAIGMRERSLRTLFGVFLAVMAVYFGVYEVISAGVL